MKTQKHSRFLAVFSGLLSAVFLLLSVSCPGALAANASDTPTPVRVGYFYNGDFMHKDGDGAYSGYDIEYYYMLAGYANWDIQFVEYDSLKSALAALKTGEIDVMSGLSKTEERVASYLVSGEKMCTAQIAVQTRADDDRFAAGDTATMENMTCGILKGSNVVALYNSWCEANGLTPHVVEYDTLDMRNAALADGEVDAIAGGSTIEGTQKVAQFPSLDLYFMFNPNRADLKKQLDRAMGILDLENPTFAMNLFLKYFPSTRNTEPAFSADEKAFIAEHPVIRVAVLADDAPFSSKNADGAAGGILPDYFAHLSAVVGAEFQCVPYADKDAAVAALHAGEVDLVGKFADDVYEADSRDVILSVPYLSMSLVQITRAGTGTVSSAAVPQCNTETIASAAAAAGISLEACLNSEQSFRKLRSGAVDSVICTQPAAAWLLNRNRASDYTVLAYGSDTWDASCAFASGRGNTLRSILDKAITVDNGYINQLITSETLEDSADLSDLFDRLPVSVIAAAAMIAVVLLAVAIVALVIIIRRRKTERLLAERRAALAAQEQANQAKHTFFGAVSHDMRTPLNGIMGFADLALASDDPSEIRDYLGKIRRSGAMLTALVNDTLIMSRMENGKYVLHPAPVDTSEILGEVIEPIQRLADEKGVALKVNVACLRPRRILADRLSLQKILLNLLSNAVKFTPSGGTVTLGCRFDSADGAQVNAEMTVSDTGSGIREEFLPCIFEPFAQENPDNADTSGSGMGLSIVKSIVDAMGGTIVVSSRKGEGTTFTVRLHFEELPPVSSVPEEKQPVKQDLLRGKRALLCEDNELNMEILRSLLESYGMETVCVENGRLGVEKFQKSAPGTFDAVLLDLRMPVLDGVSAAREIRGLNRSDARTVPLLAVSADAYEEDVEKCLAAGMSGHVAKPIDPERLYRTLVEILKKQG